MVRREAEHLDPHEAPGKRPVVEARRGALERAHEEALLDTGSRGRGYAHRRAGRRQREHRGHCDDRSPRARRRRHARMVP